MDGNEYLTLAGEGRGEYDEKRSRFLGVAFAADNPEAVLERVAQIKSANHDARHNCYAYLLKDGSKRYSDDGEPQGTAGRPMLDMLEKKGVFNCAVVVTRYFGGILLGTGGLVRAYTNAAADAVENAGIAVMKPYIQFSFSCSYEKYSRVQSLLSACAGITENSDFSDKICLTVNIPAENSADFPDRLIDATLGESRAETQKELFICNKN